jgi:S-adenosylmethionine synthetase
MELPKQTILICVLTLLSNVRTKTIYSETAAYGHMDVHETLLKHQADPENSYVELFTWEKLNFVDQVKAAFSCNTIFIVSKGVCQCEIL